MCESIRVKKKKSDFFVWRVTPWVWKRRRKRSENKSSRFCRIKKGIRFEGVRMSVVGKQLNSIQSSGHGDDASNKVNDTEKNANTCITPDEVLRLTSIADDYLCSAGK